jgi:uncharacterized membrane protein
MAWLVFILRWLHLVAAMTLVGGTIFMRFGLAPSFGVLSDEHRRALHEQVRSRWSKLVMASITFLLISGFVNYVIFYQTIQTAAWDQWRHSFNAVYQAVFGVKFLLAMAIFFIASAASGRSESLRQFRQNAKLWLTVNVVFAISVVALSGILRLTHIGPTLADGGEPQKPAATAPAGDTHG